MRRETRKHLNSSEWEGPDHRWFHSLVPLVKECEVLSQPCYDFLKIDVSNKMRSLFNMN